MKRLRSILTVLFCFVIVSYGLSEEGTEEAKHFQKDVSQVKLIISDQIAAFSALDVDRAYAHAAESIKAIFPSSKIFGNMVRNSYPMIWNPKSYEFISTSLTAVGILQRVLFTDQDGKIHFFDYLLENNGERWLISGVYVVKGEKGV